MFIFHILSFMPTDIDVQISDLYAMGFSTTIDTNITPHNGRSFDSKTVQVLHANHTQLRTRVMLQTPLLSHLLELRLSIMSAP